MSVLQRTRSTIRPAVDLAALITILSLRENEGHDGRAIIPHLQTKQKPAVTRQETLDKRNIHCTSPHWVATTFYRLEVGVPMTKARGHRGNISRCNRLYARWYIQTRAARRAIGSTTAPLECLQAGSGKAGSFARWPPRMPSIWIFRESCQLFIFETSIPSGCTRRRYPKH